MLARQPDDLPDAARGYVAFLAAGAPVSYVAVGPGREQFIVME